MRMRDLWLVALMTAACIGTPAVASATQPASPTVPAERAPTQVVHVPTQQERDAERYADLEEASEEASEFEGGRRGPILGGVLSTVLIVTLVVVLLVVLL